MKNPLKEKAKRLPGQSLDEKLSDYVDRELMSYFIFIVFCIVIIINEWIRFIWSIQPKPIPLSLVGLIIIVYCVYKIINNKITARNIIQGREGERLVGQKLEELRSEGCLIYHDILGEGFNIDHVVISPKGIFTIETKTWCKRDGNQKIWFDGNKLEVNGHNPDRDPVAQCFAQANSLKQIFRESTGKDFPVKPVIVFPGWFVDSDSTRLAQERGFWLLNPEVLSSFMSNLPIVYNEEELKMLSFNLTRYIKTTL